MSSPGSALWYTDIWQFFFFTVFFFDEIIVQYKCLKERGFRGKQKRRKRSTRGGKGRHYCSTPLSSRKYTRTRAPHTHTHTHTHTHAHALFFFFFVSFHECCLTRQWQSTECDTRYMVQRKKFDVILRFLVDRYWWTKPPKPDASKFVVPARLPTGNRFRVVFLLRGLTTMCQKSTAQWTASFSWRVKEAALLVRIVRYSKNLTVYWWQHDLHSPPQPIDWREHTIGAVHDRNLPTRSLQVPVISYENFLWSTRVKVRSIVTGLRHDDERDDDRSHCRVSIMSSLWRGLISGWSRISWSQSRDSLLMIARWHQCGTMTSLTCSHDASFSAVKFDRLPVRISTSDLRPSDSMDIKLYHIRAYDFGVQFSTGKEEAQKKDPDKTPTQRIIFSHQSKTAKTIE